MKYNKRFFALALSFLMFSSGMSFAEGKDSADIFQAALIPKISEKNVPLAKHVKKSNSKKENSNEKNSNKKSNKKNKKEKAGNNPSIVVSTPFPTGKVENNAIDVKYTAKPSKNAKITQVSYIINDDFEEFIYIAGKKGVQQKGKLGAARVLLLPGENKVVFKVVDSTGKSATFDVREISSFDCGFQTPKTQPDEISNLLDDSDGKFINNRIIIYLKNGTDSAQTQKIVEYLDGTIIGKNNVVNKIAVRIQKNTEDGLKAICEDIKNKYSDTVEHATIEKLGLIGPNNEWGMLPPNINSDEISDMNDGSGRQFVNNRIIISTQKNVKPTQIEEIAKKINGDIIAKAPAMKIHTIRISKSTEGELLKMCESLTKDYPDIVKRARLSLIDGMAIQ